MRCACHNIRKSFVIAVSLIAVCALIFSSAAPAFAFMGFGEENARSQTQNATLISDADTSQLYSLGDEDSTRYNGRVWVDKSVSSDDQVSYGSNTVANNSDFLVTYSALATSTKTITQTPSDTVFILDLSASMTWGYSESGKSVPQEQSRLQAMVDSMNSAIDKLVKANPQNRIAIVTFNGACEEDQALIPTLMTAEEIQNKVSDGNYLEIKNYNQNLDKGIDKATADVYCNISEKTASTGGGTNIQAGLFRGMNILATNKDTTVSVNGDNITRSPNVILMSDGAPTTFSSSEDASYIYHRYDGNQEHVDGTRVTGVITDDSGVLREGNNDVESGSWWETNSGVQIGAGNNNDPDSADGFMTLLTASYFKNKISNTYYPDSDKEANVFTIGFGTDVQDDNMVAMANLVLNPQDNLNKTTQSDQVNEVSTAWNQYTQGKTPTVHAPIGDGGNTLHIPFVVEQCTDTTNNPTSLDYPTQYFSASNDEELDTVFNEIAGLITSQVSAPTEVTGDPVNDGYITYTDTTGKYMQIKDVTTLIYKDQKITNPAVQTEGNQTVYTFDYSFENPAYPGQTQNTNEIKITVTSNEDDTQTIEVKIPAAAIPLRTNTITLDGNGNPTDNTTEGNMPLRLCYEVGLKDGLDLQKLDQTYLTDNAEDGKINFYSNAYTENGSVNKGVGATATFEPASTNPFYFFQEDTPIYADESGTTPVTNFDSTSTYYVPITYYDGDGSAVKKEEAYIARSGESLTNYVAPNDEGEYYIKKGSPRLGNLQDVTAAKEENSTGTYENYREPTFVFDDTSNPNPQQGSFVVLLGNNGKLQIDSPSSLIISKNTTAADGLSAPANKTFAFEVTIPSKANASNVSATLHTSGEADQNVTLQFDENGKAQVVNGGQTSDIQLEGGQSLEIPGMGNESYEVKEIDSSTDGFALTQVEGASGATSETNQNPTNDVNSATAAGTVSASSDTTVTFTNTYTATGSLKLDGSKILQGRDWINGDDFTFTLTGKNVTEGAEEDSGFALPDTTSITLDYDDAQTAAQNSSTENVTVPFSFDDITFSKPGTYEFTITESGFDDEANVENSSGSSVTYLYSVTDDGNGHLNATQASKSGAYDFVNTYDPASATANLSAIKTVNGASDGVQAGTFTFQIQEQSAPSGASSSLPSNASDGTVKNGADGTIDFGTFTFDAPGQYVYTVSEIDSGAAGYTYDSTTYTVVFDVTDDPTQGKLVATPTVYKGTEQNEAAKVNTITFANTYHPEAAPATTSFSGKKSVTTESGQFSLEAGQFSFVMKNTSAPEGVSAPTPSVGSTVENDANGDFDFGTLTFTEPGMYTYTVSEVQPTNASEGIAGITYDGTQYTLSFNVKDNNGVLTVDSQTITSSNGSTVNADELNFTNIYNDGTVGYQIAGTKILDTNGFTGADLSSSQFKFALIENGTVLQTVSNGEPSDNSASFAFDPIVYDEVGTHTYTVCEVGTDGGNGTGGTDSNNIVYSKEVYTVTVTVSQASGAEGEHGGLQAVADVANSNITFTNEYTPSNVTVGPSGDVQIKGSKILNTAAGTQRSLKEGEFTFALQENGQDIGYATNDADGNFIFNNITYDCTQIGKHVYTVNEINNNLGGVSYDEAVYRVEVDVSENPDSHALEASVTYFDGDAQVDQMTFENSYSASSAVASLGVAKTLEGSALQEGQFTFTLTGHNDAPMPTSDTATNAADGSVLFGPITYDSVGEYDYTISEVNDGQSGITYDKDSDRTIHVSVTDNNQGSLEAHVTYGADGSNFTNVADEISNNEGSDGSDNDIFESVIDHLPKTGDALGGILALVAAIAALSAGAIIYATRKMHRPKGRHEKH